MQHINGAGTSTQCFSEKSELYLHRLRGSWQKKKYVKLCSTLLDSPTFRIFFLCLRNKYVSILFSYRTLLLRISCFMPSIVHAKLYCSLNIPKLISGAFKFEGITIEGLRTARSSFSAITRQCKWAVTLRFEFFLGESSLILPTESKRVKDLVQGSYGASSQQLTRRTLHSRCNTQNATHVTQSCLQDWKVMKAASQELTDGAALNLSTSVM